MPIQLDYPGVYIQELSSGVRTITGVSTSIAAFFGRTLRGPVDTPVRCFSYSDFLRAFADEHPKSYIRACVKQFFDNGGSDCYVVRVAKGATKASLTLQNAEATPKDILVVKAKSEGKWGNDIRLDIATNTDGTVNVTVSEVSGTTVVNSEPTYVNLSMDPASPRYIVNLVSQSSGLIDIEATSTPPAAPYTTPKGPQAAIGSALGATAATAGKNETGAVTATEYNGFTQLDRVDLFNLMVIPEDEDLSEPNYKALVNTASKYCADRRAFLLIDAPKSWTGAGTVAVTDPQIAAMRTGTATKNSAVFYPRVKYSDNGIVRDIGPCGMIAGVMARTDSQRGVWKAPAGIEADLRLVNDVAINLTDKENGRLNKLAVNCLRKFPNGIVSWGSRTVDGFDDNPSEWKYIPIRRLALFLEESLFRGTKWIVFEPNDEPLWAKVRMNLNAFMMSLFRQGAFQGSTPDKAFFVKCDGETTTANDRNLGIVNIVVGFAPLKPAEFVVINIQQIPDA